MYIAPSERRDPRPTRRLKEHLLRRQTECSLHGPTIRYEIFSANGCEPGNAFRSPSPGPESSLLENHACFRLKRATSRAISRSTARFFKSARLSPASLPNPTPSSAFTLAFFQYNFRTTRVRPFTCV